MIGTGSRLQQRAGAPRTQRLVALFAAALLLFDFPLLSLWDRTTVLFGLPMLPLALFAIWIALIVMLARIVERPD